MDSAASSPDRKPVATVTVGSVSIPIYAAPVTVRLKADETGDAPKKTYPSYVVAHYEGARRILQRRRNLEKARALAKEIAGRLNRDGSRAEYVTEKDRRILVIAQAVAKPLGLEIDEVCRKYAELQQRLKTCSVEEAVSFYLTYGQNLRHDVSIDSVYAEYLEHLAKRGVGHYHLRDTKRYVGGFVAAFAAKCTGVLPSLS